jgi:hypothetical protein
MSNTLTGLEIVNCEIGTIRSRKDHSVVFSVETPELRVSESGQLMQWHGRACTVRITPHDTPPLEMVRVDTERATKTPSQRLRNCLFVLWQQNPVGTFNEFYDKRLEFYINEVKSELP